MSYFSSDRDVQISFVSMFQATAGFFLPMKSRTVFKWSMWCFREESLMGKKKILSEKDLKSTVYPSANDIVGLVQKMLGNDMVVVKCSDGRVRQCRIRGKMKKRIWIREGDAVLVSPWDFDAETKGDIFWRYTKNQIDMLREKGYLTI